MKFYINHQENYSRLELLLRTFFGWLYIAIPHFILIYILTIAVTFCQLASFFIILFTGKYPKSIWEFIVKVQNYTLRVTATLINLADGYPAFGLSGSHHNIEFYLPYNEKVSRLRLLTRVLFGGIILIPHFIILFIRFMIQYFIMVIAWFTVLFFGKYPKPMFSFIEENMRWQMRIYCWWYFFTDGYPAFTGKVLDDDIK